nr:MAG TPA: hypothetical protein [Caudoviricetes sp.]
MGDVLSCLIRLINSSFSRMKWRENVVCKNISSALAKVRERVGN